MTTKELIREKIDAFYAEYKAKFHQNGDSYHLGIIDGLDISERILDTLEEPVSDCHDLEEAARAYSEEVTDGHNYRDLTCGFIAGAEWQKAKMISALKNDGDLPIEFIDKFHEIDRTAFQNGQVNMREQMMEGAVEGLICATITGTNAISFLSPLPKELTAGSEVRIIILPKEDE